jgi:putative DNA primase/helicase
MPATDHRCSQARQRSGIPAFRMPSIRRSFAATEAARYDGPVRSSFCPEEADKELFPKIWATELPGVLNRALEGLARLRQRGSFLLPVDCERAAREFMAQADPLSAFLEEETIDDPAGHVSLRDFRAAMAKWAAEQGLKKPLPNKRLKRSLEGLGYDVKMVKGCHRVNGMKLA